MDNTDHVLTKLVTKIQNAGHAWAKAKEASDAIEDQTKNILSKIMSEIEKKFDKDVSEAKLERLARATESYQEYVRGACAARAITLFARVKYDSLMALWESERSRLSFEREKVAKGIYHEGRG